MKIRKLILEESYGEIADELQKRFELYHIPASRIEQVIEESIYLAARINLTGSRREQPWSDSSWTTWFKNRMIFAGFFKSCPMLNDDKEIGFRTELNIFFTHLEETEEMLVNLREPGILHPRPARHRFGKITGNIRPINKTAYNIAPPPKK